MTESVPVKLPADSVPDWRSVVIDIECPLCDYNLRGLCEPRCPECGYGFAWPDLLNADQPVHRYLCEERPRRNAWSFIRTFTGSLFPRAFWVSLKPVLNLYCLTR
jgi:hypothetical protein